MEIIILMLVLEAQDLVVELTLAEAQTKSRVLAKELADQEMVMDRDKVQDKVWDHKAIIISKQIILDLEIITIINKQIILVEDHQEGVFQVSLKTYLVAVQDLVELNKRIITLVDQLAAAELIQVVAPIKLLELDKELADQAMVMDRAKVLDKV